MVCKVCHETDKTEKVLIEITKVEKRPGGETYVAARSIGKSTYWDVGAPLAWRGNRIRWRFETV